MNGISNVTAGGYLQFAWALLFVLGLIGLTAVLVRRLGLVRGLPRSGSRARLAVVEVTMLDPKRRVVLLRRDNVEHLLLLGASTETVIEQAIAPPAPFSGVLHAEARPSTATEKDVA